MVSTTLSNVVINTARRRVSLENRCHACFLPGGDGDGVEAPPLLLTGFWDEAIKSYQFPSSKSGKTLHLESSLKAHRGTIPCLASSSSYVVTGGDDCIVNISIYDYPQLAKALVGDGDGGRENGKLAVTRRCYGHCTAVSCIDVCAVTGVVVSGGGDNVVVHKLLTGQFVRKLEVGEEVVCIKVNEVGEIVVATKDSLQLWSVNGSLLRRMEGLGDVGAIELSGVFKSQYIVVATGNWLKILAFGTLHLLKEFELPARAVCLYLTPPDNSVDQYLILGLDDGRVGVICDPSHRFKCMDDALQAWFE